MDVYGIISAYILIVELDIVNLLHPLGIGINGTLVGLSVCIVIGCRRGYNGHLRVAALDLVIIYAHVGLALVCTVNAHAGTGVLLVGEIDVCSHITAPAETVVG